MSNIDIPTESPKKTGKHGGRREGAGKPAFVPTDEERKQVESYAGMGSSQEDIASLIRNGIDRETLVKYFKKDIARGKAKANLKMNDACYQHGLAGNATLIIWWEKTRCGIREPKDEPPPAVAPSIIINMPPDDR